MNQLNHVFEVYTVVDNEEIIVDILRFETEEEAREFELEIEGQFKVRSLTLLVVDLVHYLLDQNTDRGDDIEVLSDRIEELEEEVKELEGALQVAKLYIEDVIPGINSSSKFKSDRSVSAKVYPFTGGK